MINVVMDCSSINIRHVRENKNGMEQFFKFVEKKKSLIVMGGSIALVLIV